MTSSTRILAIDQGTSSSRAIVFDVEDNIVASAQQEFGQIYPADGWVEHDPEEIWRATLETCRQVLSKAGEGVAAIGITNQRETVVIWDRATGRPIGNAIVWQDRRTADHCAELRDAGNEELVTERTGLLLDPYFSATKASWMLDHIEGARERAERGELAFGTIDSFLIWRLTAGRVHATDATNASRTLLFDIHRQQWDDELLDLFRVPRSMLPEVKDSAADFGHTRGALLGNELAIAGVAGDQQAALFGQACFENGMLKSTYGTGCFAVLNTGDQPIRSRNRLLTTVGYRLDGRTTYALEGSIFVAGAAIQWLRDGLGVIQSAVETEEMAAGLDSNNGVYLVPAFTGLGAPHWDPHARGALFGLTPDTGPADLVRAALESVCYQTCDLLDAMAGEGVASPSSLRVDGGMAANDWLLQNLADITALPVERPAVIETTALGAAYLAGLQTGIFDSLDELARRWRPDRRCEPGMADGTRQLQLARWHAAVESTKSYAANVAAGG